MQQLSCEREHQSRNPCLLTWLSASLLIPWQKRMRSVDRFFLFFSCSKQPLQDATTIIGSLNGEDHHVNINSWCDGILCLRDIGNLQHVELSSMAHIVDTYREILYWCYMRTSFAFIKKKYAYILTHTATPPLTHNFPTVPGTCVVCYLFGPAQ